MNTLSRSLLIIVTLVSTSSLWSQQDSVTNPRVELTGSILYSISSTTYPVHYAGDISEERFYTWAIQPGVGVFVVGYFEVGIDIRYQRSRTVTVQQFSPLSANYFDENYLTSSRLIIMLGPGYNLPVRPGIWMFLHFKAGLYWTEHGRGGDRTEEYSKWSTSETIFPIIQGGFKLFLSLQAALIVQLQYDRLSEERQQNTTVGMGFATYF